MHLTISDWVLVGIVLTLGIVISIRLWDSGYNRNPGFIGLGITILVCVVLVFGIRWYNINTATGQRAYKDFISDLSGGIYREITITAEDGREIFHYEGKVDIETNHDGNANYILFESEEGYRHIIYYGITDTVLIIEKER